MRGQEAAAIVTDKPHAIDPSLPAAPIRPRLPRKPVSLALLTAATAVLLLSLIAVAPLYGTAGSGVSGDGQVTTTTGTASLLDVGLPLGFYAVLAVLVTLVVVGAVISTRRRAAGRAIVGLGAAGLVVSAVLAAASIGLFLLPIVGLAVATFVATGRDRGPAG